MRGKSQGCECCEGDYARMRDEDEYLFEGGGRGVDLVKRSERDKREKKSSKLRANEKPHPHKARVFMVLFFSSTNPYM